MNQRDTVLSLTALLGLGACLGGYAKAQIAPAPQNAEHKPTANDEPMYHLRRATVAVGRVTEVNGKKTFTTIGSAVIVATDATHGCLLTAKHVFYQPAIGYVPDQLWIRVAKDQPSQDDFGVPLPLVVNGKALWRAADDGSDLAVALLPDLSKYPNLHAIGLQDFGTNDDTYQGASVIILGYPALLGETYLSTPIARSGIVAWMDPGGPDKPFLVDANVFEGNSGGPVFHSRSGMTRFGGMNLGGGIVFIGIVSQDAKEYAQVIGSGPQGPFIGTNPDPGSGKPSPLFAEVRNIGGIGVIEPASKAKKLVLQVLPAPAPPLYRRPVHPLISPRGFLHRNRPQISQGREVTPRSLASSPGSSGRRSGGL